MKKNLFLFLSICLLAKKIIPSLNEKKIQDLNYARLDLGNKPHNINYLSEDFESKNLIVPNQTEEEQQEKDLIVPNQTEEDKDDSYEIPNELVEDFSYLNDSQINFNKKKVYQKKTFDDFPSINDEDIDEKNLIR